MLIYMENKYEVISLNQALSKVLEVLRDPDVQELFKQGYASNEEADLPVIQADDPEILCAHTQSIRP